MLQNKIMKHIYHDVTSSAHAWLNVQLASFLVSLLEELSGYKLRNLHRGVMVRSCDIVTPWYLKDYRTYWV